MRAPSWRSPRWRRPPRPPGPRTAGGRRSPRDATGPRPRTDDRAVRRASTTPSSLLAVTTRPCPIRPMAWWWLQRTSARDPNSRRTVLPSSVTTLIGPKAPGPGWWRVAPTRSGSCWTRSPPRVTLSTCIPRQTARSGRSWARAAVARPSSSSSRRLLVPPFRGSGRAPYLAASRSPPPMSTSPSSEATTRRYRSVPPGATASPRGGTSSASPPAASTTSRYAPGTSAASRSHDHHDVTCRYMVTPMRGRGPPDGMGPVSHRRHSPR